MTAEVKAPDVGRRCKKCGRFGRKIEAGDASGMPPGWYCEDCKRHSEQKCSVDQVLTQTLIEMIRRAPKNPTLRAHVHNMAKKPIPDDLVEWDSIRSWIEFNVDPPGYDPAQWRAVRDAETPFEIDTALVAPAPPAPRDAGVNAAVRFRDYETGTCRYEGCRCGRGNYGLTGDELTRIAEESDSESEFLQQCYDEIIDQAEEEPPDMDASDGYEYDNHETSEITDQNAEILNRDTFNVNLMNWLRMHRPELFVRMAGRPA